MRNVMMDYNHWAALGFLGEILPAEDNRVELADETEAARTADFLISNGANILSHRAGMVTVTTPPVRHHLSPAGTSGRGVPTIK